MSELNGDGGGNEATAEEGCDNGGEAREERKVEERREKEEEEEEENERKRTNVETGVARSEIKKKSDRERRRHGPGVESSVLVRPLEGRHGACSFFASLFLPSVPLFLAPSALFLSLSLFLSVPLHSDRTQPQRPTPPWRPTRAKVA